MIVVRTPKSRLLLYLAGATAFVAIGVWLVLDLRVLWRGVRFPVQAVGVASVLFFGLCGGAILRRLIGHRVSLLIDRRGIIDNSTVTPAGRILWSEIVRVGAAEVSGQRFVGIDVQQPEKVLGRAGGRRGFLLSSQSMTGFLVNIPESMLDRPAAEMIDLLNRLRSDPAERDGLGEGDQAP